MDAVDEAGKAEIGKGKVGNMKNKLDQARCNFKWLPFKERRRHKADKAVDIMSLRRGEIFFAELNPVQGSEQGGIRPVLVVQNDVGNSYSPTTIVLPITSKLEKAKLPTHVELSKSDSGLARDSVVLAEQIRTIDKVRLQQKISSLDMSIMNKVNRAMGISMGIDD